MGQREKVRLRQREFSPEELSGFLLQKIKRDAEAFLGEPVKQAVITVPAYFNDNQRGDVVRLRSGEIEQRRAIALVRHGAHVDLRSERGMTVVRVGP